MTLAASSTAAAGGRSALRNWLGVASVAVGIFTLVTTEMLPVGILTTIAADLDVSDGMVGLMITVPALVAALAAPLVAIFAGRLDRRLVLCGLIALLAVANLVCAVAPNFPILLAARILVGLSIGGFWAIGASLAPRLVPEPHVGRATSLIFSGIATASVVGVPAGTLIGDFGGWRSAFVVAGVLSIGVLIALALLLPRLPANQTLRWSGLVHQLRNPGVRAGVFATFLIVTGHFTGYTFVRPVLEQVSGIDPSWVSTLLLIYGVAGIIGNFIAGAAAGNVRRSLFIIVLAMTTAMLLMPTIGTGSVGGVVLLIVWGVSYGGVSVSLLTWMLKSAPKATEAASALLTATYNFSISFGALVGGLAVDGIGTASVLWIGGVFVLLTLAAITSTGRRSRGAQTVPSST